MKQKTMLSIAVVLSVFIFAAIGSVVRAAVVAQKAENDNLRNQIIQLQVTYSERETQYNQMIAKANQDIQKANDNMQVMAKQIAAVQTKTTKKKAVAAQNAPVSAAVPAGQNVSVKPDAAQQAAQAVALQDSQLSKPPELVNFESQVAYEVTFDTGSIYVNAQDGTVLFNGTLPREITKEEAGQVALKYLGGNNQIVQIDSINSNGKILWRTIVAAGHMVYVDTNGQVVYVQMNGSAPIGG
jgi:hypothetical protein